MNKTSKEDSQQERIFTKSVLQARHYNWHTDVGPHQAHNPNNYGRALMSALPQAIAPNPHTNLLNVYIQIANKMEFTKNVGTK
jgi:hypothetical protein